MSGTETTLNSQHILSIAAATPTGLDIEVRISKRRMMSAVLYRDHHQLVSVNGVPAKDVFVGRITDDLRCLFIGAASIDVTPAAADAIDAWLARQLQALTA